MTLTRALEVDLKLSIFCQKRDKLKDVICSWQRFCELMSLTLLIP